MARRKNIRALGTMQGPRPQLARRLVADLIREYARGQEDPRRFKLLRS